MNAKWTNSISVGSKGAAKLKAMSAFEFSEPTDIRAFAIWLKKASGGSYDVQTQFNVWLDESACGICSGREHRTIDCPQLVDTVEGQRVG